MFIRSFSIQFCKIRSFCLKMETLILEMVVQNAKLKEVGSVNGMEVYPFVEQQDVEME